MNYLREKSSSTTSAGIGLTKPQASSADGFIGHDHSTDEQEFFSITVAEKKAEIQPGRRSRSSHRETGDVCRDWVRLRASWQLHIKTQL
jgi:hypothetical protein